MTEKRRVEFIESYIKIGNSDYQWHDNHGELIRCKDCKCLRLVETGRKEPMKLCENLHISVDYDFFCADGEREDDG